LGTSTDTGYTNGLYLVKAVVDGDTVKVEIDGKTETLRLIGLDTPETVDPRKPVQCFGREASNKAKEILDGKRVKLEADITQGERDKYGRLLRYLFLEDGALFNKLMIADGYAHEYTYQSNPYKYQKEFKEAERYARENKKGLWSASACGGDTSKAAASSTAAIKDKR
jgi:micrococcal nuclease